MAFHCEFTPVLAKHTKSFNLIDTLSVGVDSNFEPLERQIETWRKTQITDDTAKVPASRPAVTIPPDHEGASGSRPM